MSLTRVERRLADLPYHVEIANILLGSPQFMRMVDAMDWLYEHGPYPRDWYVYERPGENVKVWTGTFNMMKNTTSWTFAFRHKKDAALFKLTYA